MGYDIYIKTEMRQNAEDLFKLKIFTYAPNLVRSYEWSAFLCKKIAEKNNITLNPFISKYNGVENGMVAVGISNNIFEQIFNKKRDEIKFNDDGYFIIDVSDLFDSEEWNIDNYKQELNEWKTSIPINKSSTKKKDKQNTQEFINESFNNISLFKEIFKIVSYDFEKNAEKDIVDFVKEIKNNLTKIIF